MNAHLHRSMVAVNSNLAGMRGVVRQRPMRAFALAVNSRDCKRAYRLKWKKKKEAASCGEQKRKKKRVNIH